MKQATTRPPTPPSVAPAAAVVAGVPSSNASAVYEGYRAQRRELTNQLEQLAGTRETISSQLEELPPSATERKALENRLSDVDQRIATVDQMLATNAVQLAQAAAVPGAVVETPRVVRQGPPEEAYLMGGLVTLALLLPISIALARRVWRRSAAAVTALPRDISERLNRMEQSIEAAALEVERIGEGQRFLTRLFTEAEAARAIGAPSVQSTQAKPLKSADRLP